MFWDGFRERYTEAGLLLFRVVFGFLFLLHGLSKFGLLGGGAKVPGGIMLVAAIIESLGGLLILLGLFTSWAAFIASGMMAVTYWWKHAFNGQFWNPLSNGGEAAVLFCFAFLYLWLRGAGTYSLDEKLR